MSNDNEKLNRWKSLFRNMFSALDPTDDLADDSETDSQDDIEDNDIPEWYDEIPDMPETPLQDAVYETMTDIPLDFDPIEYLYSENVNADIMGSFTVRNAIRTHYNDCVSDITEYADYSSPRSERRQETVKVEDHRIKIAIEINSADGVNYHIKITFTLKD